MRLLEKRTPEEKLFDTDKVFDLIYPSSIQLLALPHWTPIEVAKKAAHFLAMEDNSRILDIGSGVGKFCLTAAHFKPKSIFYGIEQRERLVNEADAAKQALHVRNAFFINGNFTQIDFSNYDHFYFFNSFYENLVARDKIDNSIEYSGELFNYYNHYLYNQLDQRPAGTKLVTYHSLEYEVPKSYHVKYSQMDNLLKYWVKI